MSSSPATTPRTPPCPSDATATADAARWTGEARASLSVRHRLDESDLPGRDVRQDQSPAWPPNGEPVRVRWVIRRSESAGRTRRRPMPFRLWRRYATDRQLSVLCRIPARAAGRGRGGQGPREAAPVVASIRTTRSRTPPASTRPSGLHASGSPMNGTPGTGRRRRDVPSATENTSISAGWPPYAAEPIATSSPSGLNATANGPGARVVPQFGNRRAGCSVCRRLPVATSTIAVSLSEPSIGTANRVPSGENVASQPVVSAGRASFWRPTRSSTAISPPLLATRSVVSSGVKPRPIGREEGAPFDRGRPVRPSPRRRPRRHRSR